MNCCHTKVWAFIAAAVNLLVGGLTLGGFIYKVVVIKNGRIGLIVIMFLMSILLIYNGILLIVGIVMVNKVYVLLYLVLNCMNWLVGTFVIIKEISYNIAFAGFLLLVIIMTCLDFVVYKFYKQMCKLEVGDTEAGRGKNIFRK